MLFENELNLMRKTFEKSSVSTALISDTGIAEYVLSHVPGRPTDDELERISGMLPGEIEPKTLYMLNDGFSLNYAFFRLPVISPEPIVILGPYLSESITSVRLDEIKVLRMIPDEMSRYVFELYSSVPVIKSGHTLFLMLDSFCERLWDSRAFSIVRCAESQPQLPLVEADAEIDGYYGNVLVNIQALERRYEFENAIIEAVTHGQIQMEKRLVSAFSSDLFEKRVKDPLRNAKNYGIIMNTLLRKAAENGGVHPLHIDKISTEFALRIEALPSVSDNFELMCDMFRAYCRLVRKHSVMNYSPSVKNAVLIIESNLSGELSANSLAKSQELSLGYFSTLFKRETGKSISDYIREKRMKRAAHLLRTTDMQIQSIAAACGILDVQYFSKLFRREYGVSPKQFKENQVISKKNVEG